MRIHCLLLLAIFFPATQGDAQSGTSAPIQVSSAYSWLSNSFNGVPGARHALSGWNAGIAFQQWHRLRFRFDYSMYRGSNLGAPQHAFFIMGGGQYEARIRRERFYALALVGEGGLDGKWFKADTTGFRHGNSGTTASLAEFLGGGADTPISRHFAFRVEGGVQHSNFVPIEPSPQSLPYHPAGIPNYFGRLSAGIVWMPRESAVRPAPASASRAPVDSEVIFEALSSFGHFHIFADSWWSYLSAGGVEYDRHSWGHVIGAQVDYSAGILPVVILRQPSKTDIWGDPLSRSLKTIPGIGVFPLGVRLIWFHQARLEPYYIFKAGMTGYTQKTFSQFASYENFGLDQSVGMEFRLTGRTGFRAGFGILHQSDGFVVPSNPGLDEMNWNVGLVYRPGRPRAQN